MIKYYYKLNDNHNPDRRVKRNTASIAGTILSTKDYSVFDQEIVKFKSFLRTGTNKDGIIDFKVVDEDEQTSDTKKVVATSEAVNPENLLFCTKEDLDSLNRSEIENIAKSFGIKDFNVDTKTIKKSILKEQEKVQKEVEEEQPDLVDG